MPLPPRSQEECQRVSSFPEHTTQWVVENTRPIGDSETNDRSSDINESGAPAPAGWRPEQECAAETGMAYGHVHLHAQQKHYIHPQLDFLKQKEV